MGGKVNLKFYSPIQKISERLQLHFFLFLQRLDPLVIKVWLNIIHNYFKIYEWLQLKILIFYKEINTIGVEVLIIITLIPMGPETSTM